MAPRPAVLLRAGPGAQSPVPSAGRARGEPLRGLLIAAALIAAAVLALAATPVALVLGTVGLSLAVVTGVARLCGLAARRVGQPAVLGEIVGGFLLGPSVLGAWWPAASGLVASGQAAPWLAAVAQAGLLLFTCEVGAEFQLPPRLALATAGGAVAITIIPFALGAFAAAPLAGTFAGVDYGPLAFAAFVGTALSVTAFPVLVRIVADTGLRGTAVGTVAILTAALVDVLAWSALAVGAALVDDRDTRVPLTLALLAGLSVGSLLGVRPLLSRVAERYGDSLGPFRAFLLVMATLAALAAATDALGAHAMFGALMAGLALPRCRAVADTLRKVGRVNRGVLLPVFFASVGMQVDLGRIVTDSTILWGGVLLMAAAVLGKIGSALAVGLSAGLALRPALAFAVLMNARGATEVVVLNAGLAMGAINQTAYSVLVVIALLTTAMVTPSLRLIRPLDEETPPTVNLTKGP